VKKDGCRLERDNILGSACGDEDEPQGYQGYIQGGIGYLQSYSRLKCTCESMFKQ
jgi:hypothetical protein